MQYLMITGEFVSKEFIDFCENFNMKVKTTVVVVFVNDVMPL